MSETHHKFSENLCSGYLGQTIQAARAQQEEIQRAAAEIVEKRKDELRAIDRLKDEVFDFVALADTAGIVPTPIELTSWRLELYYNFFSKRQRAVDETHHKSGWELVSYGRDDKKNYTRMGVYTFTDGTVLYGPPEWDVYQREQTVGFSPVIEKEILDAMAGYLVGLES